MISEAEKNRKVRLEARQKVEKGRKRNLLDICYLLLEGDELGMTASAPAPVLPGGMLGAWLMLQRTHTGTHPHASALA